MRKKIGSHFLRRASVCLLIFLYASLLYTGGYLEEFTSSRSRDEQELQQQKQDAVNAATGSVFSGAIVRKFSGTWKHQQSGIRTTEITPPSRKQRIFDEDNSTKFCERWAVVTTINSPTEAIKSTANLEDWCMVIVGDKKTPSDDYDDIVKSNDHVVFLSARDQQKLKNTFVRQTPFNSFARKNVGYLYAISHGAKIIFDFDDDNALKHHRFRGSDTKMATPVPPSVYPKKSPSIRNVTSVRFLPTGYDSNGTSSPAFNPLPWMKPMHGHPWPRGFPLEDLKNEEATPLETSTEVQIGEIAFESIGVIQSLADGDPDVDAIYRLTRELPLEFEYEPTSSSFLIPPNLYSPYNAQCTIHMESAFWGLLLPVTVPGRVSDIWRSYFTQNLLHELNLGVIYTPPLVVQDRNSHNYVADMEAELDLYFKTSSLLKFLSHWKDGDSRNVPARLENLWVSLYERGYIELNDVLAMQEWLSALLSIGYQFPDIVKDKQQNMLLKATPQLYNQGLSLEGVKYIGEAPKPYGNFLTESKLPGREAWKQWLQYQQRFNRTSATRTFKAVLMTMDEYPLVKNWVLYHGEMLGFHNLYILDGSTDHKSVEFLMEARDNFGVNVVFTASNLNELTGDLNKIMSEIAPFSDSMIKLDTDEFLVLDSGNKSCSILAENMNHPNDTDDCMLSPYGVKEYFDSSSFPLDGKMLHVGCASLSVPNQKLCEGGLGDQLGRFGFGATFSFPKVFFDSRTFRGVDLGSHTGALLAPFASVDAQTTKLSLLHFHSRCLLYEIESARQACRSHGFFQEGQTTEEILAGFRRISRVQDFCSDEEKECVVNSCHKIWFYAKSLDCPEKLAAGYYPTSNGAMNPEFNSFLRNVLKKYGGGR